MENNKFENSWKKALQDAESTPSGAAWSSIEADLMTAENIVMRRNVVIYKRIAAAAVFFACLATALSLYYTARIKQTVSADSNSTEIKKESASRHTESGKAADELAASGESVAKTTDAKQRESSVRGDAISTLALKENRETFSSHADAAISADAPASQKQTLEMNPGADSPGTSLTQEVYSRRQTASPAVEESSDRNRAPNSSEPEYYTTQSAIHPESAVIAASDTTLPGAKKEPVQIATSPEKVKVMMGDKTQQDKIRTPDLFWISACASAGSYSPGMKSKANQGQYGVGFNSSTVRTFSINPKASSFYSAGIMMGRKLFSRWTLQGGLSYINQTARFTSDFVSASAAVAVPGITTSFAVSSPVGVYSPTCTMEFISVPVQLGYAVSDGRLLVLFNAGAAPNFFVRNTLRDPSGNVKTYSEGPGSRSPYRNVSWTGLLNAEVGFKMTGRYRFSIVPGMRYALNSSLKSGADKPFVLDLGFRIRYMFH